MHCTCRTILGNAFMKPFTRATAQPLPFLLPNAILQRSAFSSSAASSAPAANNASQRTVSKGRKSQRSVRKLDTSPFRGQSPMRRTGLNRKNGVSVDLSKLPRPRLEGRSSREVDPNHGLWQFLSKDKNALSTPEQLHDHGRGWTIEELRAKDWHDLHRLWWACVKDLNRLATFTHERERLAKHAKTEVYGAYECRLRELEVKKTMQGIKATLLERYYAFEDARVLAMSDPQVNLYAKKPSDALRQLEEVEVTSNDSQSQEQSLSK